MNLYEFSLVCIRNGVICGLVLGLAAKGFDQGVRYNSFREKCLDRIASRDMVSCTECNLRKEQQELNGIILLARLYRRGVQGFTGERNVEDTYRAFICGLQFNGYEDVVKLAESLMNGSDAEILLNKICGGETPEDYAELTRGSEISLLVFAAKTYGKESDEYIKTLNFFSSLCSKFKTGTNERSRLTSVIKYAEGMPDIWWDLNSFAESTLGLLKAEVIILRGDGIFLPTSSEDVRGGRGITPKALYCALGGLALLKKINVAADAKLTPDDARKILEHRRNEALEIIFTENEFPPAFTPEIVRDLKIKFGDHIVVLPKELGPPVGGISV